MSTDREKIILVSNDDGIDAPGIRALAEAMTGLGRVYVVAPVSEQSAVGHAITVRNPVRAHARRFDVASGQIDAFSVTGTPADCVKLAVNQLLPRHPDLVVSGINRGPNTAVNVIYSGTVSAATEAAILGIPSVAVSNCAWSADADFEAAGRYARLVAEHVLRDAALASNRARGKGRKRRAVFQTQMRVEDTRFMAMVSELHTALHEHQFRHRNETIRAGWLKYPVAESLIDRTYAGVPGALRAGAGTSETATKPVSA